MKSYFSQQSIISKRSQQVLEIASKQADPKFATLDDVVDQEQISKCWGAFGLYISRQLRMGRAIIYPHFGTFTFSAPDCNLNGVTNPDERDKQFRVPVFLVSKEFVKGKPLRTAIYIENHLRPFNVQTNGKIQVTKINFAEICCYAQMNKETCKYAVDRMIRVLADKTRQDQTVDMEIPGVGYFTVRSGLVAVNFQESLIQNTKGIAKRPLSERKKKGEMNLNSEALSILDFQSSIRQKLPIQLDPSAKQYLLQNYEYDTDQFSQSAKSRPKTAKAGWIPDIKTTKGNNNTFVNNFMNGSKIQMRPQTAIGQQTANSQIQFEQLSAIQFAMKRLKFWIRQNHLNAQDAFLEMCNNAIGRSRDRKVKITQQQFSEACAKMELQLNEEQILQLFNLLDYNKDGFINYEDWQQVIKDDNQHLFYIKDVIYKRQLHTDDVLKTMNLTREHTSIDIYQLKNSLKLLDLTLTDYTAMQVARSILQGKPNISMQELAETLDCIEEVDKEFDLSWFKDILYKIKQKLLALDNPNELKESFQNYDEHNVGSLDTANFKTCLMRSSLRLSVKDINRIVRYLPKENHNSINYYHFLEQVERVDLTTTSLQVVSDIKEFAQKLGQYLKQKKLSINTFLKTIRHYAEQFSQITDDDTQSVSTEQVSEYLHRSVFSGTSKIDIDKYVEQLDLDSDGFIKENDIQAFLTKYDYFDQVSLIPREPTRVLAVEKSFNITGNVSYNTKGLFPVQPLSEKKVFQVLRDLRFKLELKNMSYEDFFKMLDNDNDGFITIQEFSEQIDNVYKLSQPIKDGFFAYMDKLHIGMVDLQSFLKAMRKSVVNKNLPVEEDNFNWQYQLIMKIREWFAREKLTVEDAFRTLDKQYDGSIQEDDLYSFLIEIIKIKEEDLTKGKVNRLFKLIDQFKRGRITVDDFRRFLCEDFVSGHNQQVMGHKTIDNYSSFDWKINARQQLGLVLSRRFPDLHKSFDVISGYHKKLIYQQFYQWISANNALQGFDLTERLTQELFADLDTHKKGYLTEDDWINAFGGYNWKRQMIEEIKDTIRNNFENLQKAFDFFLQGATNGTINFNGFNKAINYIFPRRFIDSDIDDLWQMVSDGQKQVELRRFEQVFGSSGFNEKQSYKEMYMDMSKRPLSSGPIQMAGQSLHDLNTQSLTGVITPDAPFNKEYLLDKIRRFMRASNKSIVKILREADTSNCGYLTNIQFKHAMQKMNLGLSLEEIDQLINSCGADAKLNIDEFLKYMQFRQTDQRILDRSTLKLRHITNLVYTYLLSPKDAFRMFDYDSNGNLSFDQFQSFIAKISHLAGEDMPPYAIIKDLFDYFDKRRDGNIDQTEWMDVFAQFEYIPQASVPKNKDQYNNIRPKTSVGKQTLEKVNSLKNLSEDPPLEQINNNLKTLQPDYLKKGQPQQPYLRGEQQLTSKQMADMGEWESSKEFDKVLIAIGKNRKYLLEMFCSLNQRRIPIDYAITKSIIEQMLRNSGMSVREEGWPILLKFAEKDGLIDYKFLLDVYKERIKRIDSHPIVQKSNAILQF